MAGENGFDPEKFGALTQAVETLLTGFRDMRQDVASRHEKLDEKMELLRQAIGTRCTDCSLNKEFGEFRETAKGNFKDIFNRLRGIELKMAGAGALGAGVVWLLERMVK